MKYMYFDKFSFMFVLFVVSAFFCFVVPAYAQPEHDDSDPGEVLSNEAGSGAQGGDDVSDDDGSRADGAEDISDTISPASDMETEDEVVEDHGEETGEEEDNGAAENSNEDRADSIDEYPEATGEGETVNDSGASGKDDAESVDEVAQEDSEPGDAQNNAAEDGNTEYAFADEPDAGYEENCDGADCADDLNCKPDLWSDDSICCNANECAGEGKCFAEYACVSGPVKLCYEGGWIDVLDYEINCFDGIDNDCDGNIDEEDTDCYIYHVCGNGICEESETVSSCPQDCARGKTIIIRNDDIGPWWSVDNAIYLTDFIKSKGVAQTLGIIPLTGGGTIRLEDDPVLSSYLRGISEDPEIEIGISGLTHEYNEFLGISQSEAEEKIADAKQIIADSVYVEPVTFMPSYYEYDESTLHAAKNQGMEYFSAGWNAIDMGHGFSEYPSGLWNIPATTGFYDWGANTFYTANEVEESCENALDTLGTCVIILYHHTFVDGNNDIDEEKIALLGEVLDWVKDKEAQGVELKTIGKHKAVESPEPSDKYIVFRSDDFAAFWSVSSAISITETLRDMGVPQVLSIVPTNVGYKLDDDPVIANYLKDIKDDASIEIALHGYDHSVHEFRDISYADATFKVGTGLEILQNVLGMTPATFVPPYHEYNENTLRTLEMHNIGTISSGYDDFVRGREFRIDEYGILHLPVAAEFYNWWENRANTAEEIIGPCENAMENHNVCVIMLHHHMFKDANGNMDPAKVKVLTDVADWAKSKEADGSAKIALLKDIGIDDL